MEKITRSYLLKELSIGLFQIDRGFFFTLKELFRRPGTAIRNYLEGQRKKYFKPIPYVLALSTVYFLLSQLTGQETWFNNFVFGFSSGMTSEGTAVKEVLRWFAKNFHYANLLLIPVFSLASYLAFRGRKWNYLEHIVLNAYLTGQQAILYTLFVLLQYFIDSMVLQLFPLFFASGYVFLGFGQFFKKGNWFVSMLRTLLTYILYLFFSALLLFALVGIGNLLG